ncbi:MAG: response regulator [Anaerolineaceae bacterium]|nr:response regulator [Anaerolineaceae bacterium]
MDPNGSSRMNLTLLLEQMGCLCASTSSPIKAWQLLEEAAHTGKPFQVLVVDSKQILGDDPLLGHIQENPRLNTLKVLLLTTLGQRLSLEDCLEIGCSGHIYKPVRLQNLQQALLSIFSASKDNMQKENAAQRTHTRNAALHTQKPQRILLVEDNEINSKVIINLLEKYGHHVELAENGHKAVEAVRSSSYDLVLMDIQMPVMDGYEATQKIRALEEDGRQLPIFAMTAHVASDDIERCKAAGMNGYLSKPVKPQELFEKIERQAGVLPVEQPGSNGGRHTSQTSGFEIFFPSPKTLKTPVVVPNHPQISPKTPPVGSQPLQERRDRRTKPLGDPQYLENILPRFGNDLNFFIETFEAFIQQTRGKIPDFSLAVQAKDAFKVKLLAHNLKGVAANFEAVRIATLANDLELQAGNGNLAQAKAVIEIIEKEIPMLEKTLAQVKVFQDKGNRFSSS